MQKCSDFRTKYRTNLVRISPHFLYGRNPYFWRRVSPYRYTKRATGRARKKLSELYTGVWVAPKRGYPVRF